MRIQKGHMAIAETTQFVERVRSCIDNLNDGSEAALLRFIAQANLEFPDAEEFTQAVNTRYAIISLTAKNQEEDRLNKCGDRAEKAFGGRFRSHIVYENEI